MIGRCVVAILAVLCVFQNIRVSDGGLHEKCLLPVAEGNCSESIQRWYYNNRTGVCQVFTYRGCNGNANNFNSTEYCYHACNASSGELHSYSIADISRKIKGNRSQQSSVADNQANNTDEHSASDTSNAVTQPTNFDETRRRAASTREPSLIRNRNSNPNNAGSSSSRRQPVKDAAAGTGAAAATPDASGSSSSSSSSSSVPSASDAAAKPSRTKRSTSSKSERQRTTADQHQEEVAESEEPETVEADDIEVPTRKSSVSHHRSSRRLSNNAKSNGHSREVEEEDDTEEETEKAMKKKRKNNTGQEMHESDHKDLDELVSHMESTAEKLQKVAAVAKMTAKSKAMSKTEEKEADKDERDEKEKKKTEGDTDEADTKEKEPKAKLKKQNASTRRRHHTRRKSNGKKLASSSTKERKNSEKLSKKGGSKRIDITVIGSNGIATGSAYNRKSSLADLLKMGLDEGRKSLPSYESGENNKGDDNEDDDEFEIVGERIRTIIFDPSYVFSYSNISKDDMVSLQEMMSQADVGSMKMIEKEKLKQENKDDDVASVSRQKMPIGDTKTASPLETVAEERAQVAAMRDETTSPKQEAEAPVADRQAKIKNEVVSDKVKINDEQKDKTTATGQQLSEAAE